MAFEWRSRNSDITIMISKCDRRTLRASHHPQNSVFISWIKLIGCRYTVV